MTLTIRSFLLKKSFLTYSIFICTNKIFVNKKLSFYLRGLTSDVKCSLSALHTSEICCEFVGWDQTSNELKPFNWFVLLDCENKSDELFCDPWLNCSLSHISWLKKQDQLKIYFNKDDYVFYIEKWKPYNWAVENITYKSSRLVLISFSRKFLSIYGDDLPISTGREWKMKALIRAELSKAWKFTGKSSSLVFIS